MPDAAHHHHGAYRENEIVGTLHYMSAEQLHAQATGQEINARSDMFSFSLVLYEILTSKRIATVHARWRGPKQVADRWAESILAIVFSVSTRRYKVQPAWVFFTP